MIWPLGKVSRTFFDYCKLISIHSILAAWYRFAPIENPGFGIPTSLLTPHEFVDARDPASKSTIFQSAVEGHVLVKNVNGTLPLRAPKVLSLFGYDAVAPLQNDWPPSGYGKWTKYVSS